MTNEGEKLASFLRQKVVETRGLKLGGKLGDRRDVYRLAG